MPLSKKQPLGECEHDYVSGGIKNGFELLLKYLYAYEKKNKDKIQFHNPGSRLSKVHVALLCYRNVAYLRRFDVGYL